MRDAAHAGADVARRGRRRARRRRPARRVGPAELHAAPLDRAGRRRRRAAGGRRSGSPAWPATCSATAPRRRRPARSCRSSSTAWCEGRSNWRSPRAERAPDDGFAWLTLGSVARREAMPSSDVDSALSWRDDLSRPVRNCGPSPLASTRSSTAAGCRRTRNGAVASKPLFSRSQSEWFAAAEGWLDDPLRDQGLIMSSLLHRRPRGVGRSRRCTRCPRPIAGCATSIRTRCGCSCSTRCPARSRTRSLRDVLSRRGGTFDLKSHAVTPIVNLARWGGLTRRRRVGVDAGAAGGRRAGRRAQPSATPTRCAMSS